MTVDNTGSATSVDLEVVMPRGYPYSRSVRPELFDRVWGRAPPRWAAQDPHGLRATQIGATRTAVQWPNFLGKGEFPAPAGAIVLAIKIIRATVSPH